MLEFKPITLEKAKELKKKLFSPTRFSCETNIVNLLVWQKMYDNMYAEDEGMLFIKSGGIEKETFRLPFGENIKRGIEKLCEYTGEEHPKLWVQQGERFEDFKLQFGEEYELIPERDAFDYIYLQEDLANLSGKKYHSKRNHISAFSKQYDWKFKEITAQDIPKVLECANEWYASNKERFDKYMECEKQGIELMLSNMELLDIKGGAIYIDEKIVAFTLGSPINCETFDIHIEKALPEYATAYTVINREFAKILTDYKYINREDDLGLEGLRKAKLSYKPYILLKKYAAVSKAERIKQIYHEAFGEEDNSFEDDLFNTCFEYCRYLEKDGRIVSVCFEFPCVLNGSPVKYIFAVTTAKEFRSNGYAKELIESLGKNGETLILRPVDSSLVQYYKSLGFCEFKATNQQSDFSLEPVGAFKELAQKYADDKGEFTAMYKSENPQNLNNLTFLYSLP
ncbi:MAG: DUF2156 domain-containing protein [Ruminococcaceae bacterium]|nr:DUF2156 domain-containing protein [Oscillospiraceae bacterium]